MSGFLFHLRPLSGLTDDQAAERLSFVVGDRVESIHDGAFSGVSVRSDDSALWASARDPETGVTAWLYGRIALDIPEWEGAKRLPYMGGLACQQALDEFLHTPEAFPGGQNGAFAFVIWDPRDQILHLATDRMGYVPVYAWNGPERPVLATHPDVLADAVGATALDRSTMAEALLFGQALPPHTYYEAIEELAPGTVFSWSAHGGQRSRTYWSPEYAADASVSVRELADDLTTAITGAVQRRTLPHLGQAAVMLSGGIDSRAVLYAACDPSLVTSVTLYTEPNAELATARTLAERAGSRHVGLQRSFEHYGAGAREASRITGGMWNVLDAHYTELIPQLDALGTETTLTGCYADYLFKGLTTNRRRRTLFGRALPLYEFSPHRTWWYVPRGPLSNTWAMSIQNRRDAHFEGLDPEDTSDAGRWAYELRRFRPVAREADTASRLLLQRALRWDPIFADDALLKMYQRVPPSLKLNGKVWEQAVAQICRDAGDVINNNTQGRIGKSDTRKVLSFLYGVAYRKVFHRDLDGTRLGSATGRGSWPDFNHYIRHSAVLPSLWETHCQETNDILSDLLGENIAQASLADWSGRYGAHVAMRVLTLKVWLDQRLTP